MPTPSVASTDSNDHVAVSWSGKKLLIAREKLDEWYHAKPFEEKVDYAESHPELIVPTKTTKQQKIPFHHFNKHASQSPNINDYVLVHWSGDKVLLLHRGQLDEWYHSSYEMHHDYVKRHPECVLPE